MSPPPFNPTADVLAEVYEERVRQDEKWGEQNLPDGTGGSGRETYERIAKLSCERATREGRLTFLHVLEEEFCEAAAETDEAKLRAELVQLAAVAAKWIEAIDRRKHRR